MIISTPEDTPIYKKLLGDGRKIGMKLCYKVQETPRGLEEAFILGEEFIGNDSCCLVSGDNVFYGFNMIRIWENAIENNKGTTIFRYPVKDPNTLGVVEFDSKGTVLGIEEKPKTPKSNYSVPSSYFYDNRVIGIAKNIQPSARGELEITAVNNEYLKMGDLKVTLFSRGFAWIDTGTSSGMLKASEFVETIQKTQGNYVSCIEEIAWRRGFISTEQFRNIGESLKMTDYGKYILTISVED